MNTVASRFTKSRVSQRFIALFTMPGLALLPMLPMLPASVNANPTGPQVVAGAATFQGLGSAGLTINQGTNAAIINWANFSIGAGEFTHFNQPGINSITINRVLSNNPSAILGRLSATGSLMLINQNGIMVGPSGVIDVAGSLTLSTLDSTNQDLLSGGSSRFSGTSGAGVINYGAISGRDVTILGNFISNPGSITADRSIALGAGGDIIVDQTADGAVISVRGGAPTGGTGIDNAGTISGATVQAEAHGNSYAMAINNRGTVRARGYNFRGGRLTLSAGSSGRMINTGNLYAQRSDGSGGQINISGGEVALESGRVDAGGGTAMAGGEINVQATDISVGENALVIADGGTGGSINMDASGSLQVAGTVTSRGSLRDGGSIDLAGDEVSAMATAVVDVTGMNGGQIRAGGGFQGNDADIRNSTATNVESGALFIADGELGNGGEVILWSDGDTMFGGEVSARATGFYGNGGFVEVSGKNWLSFLGFARTDALNGTNGTLLLDPTDVTIGPASLSSITISDAALVAAVLSNNVVVHTSSAANGSGNIFIEGGSDIQYDSPNSLSFFAHGSIFVNGDIKNHGTTDTAWNGTGHITLVAGWDGTGASNFAFNPGDGSGVPSINDPVVDAASILAGTYGSYGVGSGAVFLNDAALEPVEVGSARGETNVFGDFLIMQSGNNGGEFTQLGYRRENDLLGRAIAYDPTAGQNSGLGADGIIGTADDNLINTGTALNFDNGVTGDINVYTNSGVFMLQHPGENFDEGVKNVDRTYVMIGHGGLRQNDNDIDERGFNDTNGGNNNLTTADLIHLENEALGFTGFTADRATGHTALNADYGSDAGITAVGNGDNHGNITINTGGLLALQAARAEGFAMIGHGGSGGDDPDHLGGEFAVSDRNRLGNNATQSRDIFGNMTGDITITARSIDMEGGRYNQAPVQIGHGGMRVHGIHYGNVDITTTGGGITAHAAPDSATGGPLDSNDWRWRSNRDQSYVQIGHGGFDSHFLFLTTLGEQGGSAGSIKVPGAGTGLDAYDTVGGVNRPDTDTSDLDADIFMDANPRRQTTVTNNAGDITINTTRPGDGIALNRIRGIFSDDANQTVNGIAGGVTNTAFGHGGNINVNAAGSVEFTAANGTDAYAMIGHGGRSTTGDHTGNVTVTSTGNIIFTRDAYQINERGRDITNRGHRAHVQIGHGGTRYNGGSTGDINVNATGNIEFYGGRAESYAMIGHGGRGDDGSIWNGGRQNTDMASGTHSGNINVTSGGNIKFRSGFTDQQAFSMIGHGGYRQYADTVENNAYSATKFGGTTAADQVGHNGNIVVDATGSISFVAGQTETLNGQDYAEMNGNDNFTMIGHGGYLSKGDHYGTIGVTAGGDLNIEARGGWKGVGISGNNATGTARIIETGEDASQTGIRNFAQIGHGGVNSAHANNDNNDNWNNSGVNSNGIGVIGNSDISINVTGSITALGAMKATAGDKPMPTRVFLANSWDENSTQGGTQFNSVTDNTATGTDESQAIYVDELGNVVTLGEGYSQHNGRFGFLTTVAISDPDGDDGADTNNDGATGTITVSAVRTNGDVWDMPDAVLAAVDGYVQIGNGGRATSYIGSGGADNGAGTAVNSVDGAGHRGNISINYGGDMRVEAGDIKRAVATGQSIAIRLTDVTGIPDNGTLLLGPAGGTETGAQQDDPSPGYRNYAMIGLGGDAGRGDHNGTISIIGTGVNSGGNLDLIAGEGQQAFAMIGAGGYDADRNNSNNARDGDIGQTSDITINIAGKLTMLGGGLQNDDTTGIYGGIDPATGVATITADNGQTQGSFVQIGAGGSQTGGNHTAEIDIDTGAGVELEAGNSTRGAYGMIGSGGYWGRSETLGGNISVVSAAGDIVLNGAQPVLDGLDEPAFGPANPGNIQTAREAFVQIGNGGLDTDAQGGNQNNQAGDGSGYSGNIEVVAATGSVILDGGGGLDINADNDNFRGMYVKIGNGGIFSDGDSTGNIRVAAGLDLSLDGGEASRAATTQIGHGGANVNGDSSGSIDIDVGRNLLMRRGSSSDLSGTIVRDAYAKIGHGPTHFQGWVGNGSGDETGDITVSVGNSLSAFNGRNFQLHSAEDIAAFANGSGGTVPVAGVDETGEAIVSGTFRITATDGGTTTVNYVDDGTGNIVQAGTTTVVGTVDYTAGTYDITTDITAGATLTTVEARYATGVVVDGVVTANEVTAFGPQIGHVDPKNTAGGFPIRALGDTYIAVSRDAAIDTGTFFTEFGTVFSSADGGFSTELRLYMPSANQNFISAGTYLNNTEYDRTDVGVSLRSDETLATEHTLVIGGLNEPSGTFTPVGDYPSNAFGLYNVYYDAEEVVVPPVGPGDDDDEGGDLIPLDILLGGLGKFERDELQKILLEFDGYGDGILINLGYFDSVVGEDPDYIPVAGIEGFLDSILGPRTNTWRGPNAEGGISVGDDGTILGTSDAEAEYSERQEQVQNRASQPSGYSNRPFFIYNPGTGTYSSLRLFGEPQGNIPAFNQ